MTTDKIHRCLREIAVATGANRVSLWLPDVSSFDDHGPLIDYPDGEGRFLHQSGDARQVVLKALKSRTVALGDAGSESVAFPVLDGASVEYVLLLKLSPGENASAAPERIPSSTLDLVNALLKERGWIDSLLTLLSAGNAVADAVQFACTFAHFARRVTACGAVLIWLLDKTTNRYLFSAASPEGARPMTGDLSLTVGEVSSALGQSNRGLVVGLRTFDQVTGLVEFRLVENAGSRTDSEGLIPILAAYASRALEGIKRFQTVRRLNEALSTLGEAQSREAVEFALLQGAFSIAECRIGSVLRLNDETGALEIARYEPPVEEGKVLSVEKGVVGMCLRQSPLKPIRLGNVSTHKHFIPFWMGMRSELAIPLFVPKANVREGLELKTAEKRMGVLNLESPALEAFSDLEEECLSQLARAASFAIDRVQFDEVLQGLHVAESELAKDLAGGKDWREVVQAVGDQVRTRLGYSHVNISTVSLDGKRIKSEFVWWERSADDTEEFKRLSDHDLSSSTDIQASVVKNKQVEVPLDTARFHPNIHLRFGLDALVRVYIPMMMGDVVVGTLEAGYRRTFRKYIFERDVQILKSLADYAGAAIWKKRRGQLDILRHEMASPRRAIIDNALFLQRHWKTLSDEKINWKLDDIRFDGDLIDSLLDKVEYYIIGKPKESRLEFCDIGREVVMKTIFQQVRYLRELGVDLSRIEYSSLEVTRVRAVVDRLKACEVFNNLFGNAIKYRRSSESLRIRLDVVVQPAYFVIKLSDWGIGIEEGCESQIFDEGFRAPNAVQVAQGSGLGLWLARQYMRDMDGDLSLDSPRNPTRFELKFRRKER